MSEKVGLRALEPPRGALAPSETIGPYTNELTLDADDIKAIMSGEKLKRERQNRQTSKEPASAPAPASPGPAGLLGAPPPAPQPA
ncbi:hypothetical protein RR48_04560 [Papilio machaon]|uniref:Uncharacterized protein n=1 Tax=Papilio machaon TaxID=76193 RepID=A0A0N1PG22_PAPMA|nr:hypothetical protein RR48_04560 [Papilio machaon]